jgi:hypothetical protein
MGAGARDRPAAGAGLAEKLQSWMRAVPVVIHGARRNR